MMPMRSVIDKRRGDCRREGSPIGPVEHDGDLVSLSIDDKSFVECNHFSRLSSEQSYLQDLRGSQLWPFEPHLLQVRHVTISELLVNAVRRRVGGVGEEEAELSAGRQQAARELGGGVGRIAAPAPL